MKVLQLREFFCFSLSFIPCVCTVLDTLGRARNVLRLGTLSVPPRIGGERLLRTFLNIAPLACRCVIFLLSEFLCQAGYVNGKPFSILVGDSFQKGLRGGPGLRQRVWHHCHHVFENFWMRQSKLSLFFPRVNNFSIVTTFACCPFH